MFHPQQLLFSSLVLLISPTALGFFSRSFSSSPLLVDDQCAGPEDPYFPLSAIGSDARVCPDSAPGKDSRPTTFWSPAGTRTCGSCRGYETYQWTATNEKVKEAATARNGGSLISPQHGIPGTVEGLRCWFSSLFSWGGSVPADRSPTKKPTPEMNLMPEAAYIIDAGNGLGGGMGRYDGCSGIGGAAQEEPFVARLLARNWVNTAGKSPSECGVLGGYTGGRVILTKLDATNPSCFEKNWPNSPDLFYKGCMCGAEKLPQDQPPFYVFQVQGLPVQTPRQYVPAGLKRFLDDSRTAFSNLFDIWASRPPCSGECSIMSGAISSWVSYGWYSHVSIYIQLRALASFDLNALGESCGEKGVMLRFAGMTLLADGTVSCKSAYDPTNRRDGAMSGFRCGPLGKLDSGILTWLVDPNVSDDQFIQRMVELSVDAAAQGNHNLLAASRPESGLVLSDDESCPGQPTLNMPWRCGASGVSDEKMCGWS